MRESWDGGTVTCSAPGCETSIKDNYWARVKATGWFFQTNGKSWCPQHVPEWVEEWRRLKQLRASKP